MGGSRRTKAAAHRRGCNLTARADSVDSNERTNGKHGSLTPSVPHGAAVIACDACGLRWLVPGVVPGEPYACKSCGHTFAAPPASAPRRSRRTLSMNAGGRKTTDQRR